MNVRRLAVTALVIASSAFAAACDSSPTAVGFKDASRKDDVGTWHLTCDSTQVNPATGQCQ